MIMWNVAHVAHAIYRLKQPDCYGLAVRGWRNNMRTTLALLFASIPFLFFGIFYADGGVVGLGIGLLYIIATAGVLYCPVVAYRIYTNTENRL
jgi:hypothetical protein